MKFIDGYKEAYRDVYEFHKKYYGTVTEANWNELIDELSMISKKYNQSEFINDLLACIANEIWRVGFIDK